MKVGAGDDDQGLSRKHVTQMIDLSLSRLKCEYVDLYYMHRPDDQTPLEESILVFNDLIDSGKILHWGLSNFSAQQTAEVLQVCDENGWLRPVAVQPAYSYLKRDIEKDLLPLCVKENLAVIPYQVLQGGLLTGKYQRNQVVPVDSRMVEKPAWTMTLSDDLFDQLEKCEAEARQRGRGMLQHALMTLLEQPGVVSLIVGVKKQQQLDDLIAAVA
jgi:L-glyceraldehyde 3-phosphate reductase